MASGQPRSSWGEASILKSLWSGFITEDTVQRPASEKGEHGAEEDTAEYVLTCWRHMLQIFKMEGHSLLLVRKAGGPPGYWWGWGEAGDVWT